MLRLQHQNLPQSSFPGVEILPRKSGHQIHIDIGEPCLSRSLVAFQEILISMDSSQIIQFLIIRRLQPQAQTVDAALPVNLQLFHGQCARIGLYGDFCILRNIKALVENCKQLFHQRRRKKGGGSSSHENGNHLIFPEIFTLTVYFFNQLIHIFPVLPLRCGKGQKVAVSALADTKGNMKIQLQFLFIHYPVSKHS